MKESHLILLSLIIATIGSSLIFLQELNIQIFIGAILLLAGSLSVGFFSRPMANKVVEKV